MIHREHSTGPAKVRLPDSTCRLQTGICYLTSMFFLFRKVLWCCRLNADPAGQDVSDNGNGPGILEIKCPFNKGSPALAQPPGQPQWYYMPQVCTLRIDSLSQAERYVL